MAEPYPQMRNLTVEGMTQLIIKSGWKVMQDGRDYHQFESRRSGHRITIVGEPTLILSDSAVERILSQLYHDS